jgi:threonine/homoserine/homoserine lactone efflux protein
MDLAGLTVFAVAYLAVLILPGPGVTALVARVLVRGPSGSPAFIGGFVCGALAWLTIAATGLAALAAAFATIFVVIRYLGAAYLLYLAWRLWTAPAKPRDVIDTSPEGGWRLFLAGLAINLGNPKVIVFFLALLPTVVNLDTLTLFGFAELAGLVTVIASSVLALYAMAAAHVRRVLTAPRTIRLINRGSGVVMAGAAVAVAAR